jgi:predicted nucleic acid-binding protein
MLDTNICIAIIKRKPPQVLKRIGGGFSSTASPARADRTPS